MRLDNDTLTSFDKHFKAIEEESQTKLSIPENYFLVVRLDAFHATMSDEVLKCADVF